MVVSVFLLYCNKLLWYILVVKCVILILIDLVGKELIIMFVLYYLVSVLLILVISNFFGEFKIIFGLINNSVLLFVNIL